MIYDKFIYTVYPNEYGGKTHNLTVRIAYYDPERWDGEGGDLFGFETEVAADNRANYDDDGKFVGVELSVRVMQRGNSFCSIEEAEMRAEINRQALDMAHFIQDQLDAGEDLGAISAFLTDALTPGTPVKKGFKYSGTKRAISVFGSEALR